MNELFDRLSARFFGPEEPERSIRGGETWVPAIDSHVAKDTLIVKADLPGIDPKEVSISVKDYFYHGLVYGKFARTLTLPEGVETDTIKASYKNEVLEVTMPIAKQIASKKIQIEAQQ